MANRLPLVLDNSGQQTELPSGDALQLISAVISGGSIDGTPIGQTTLAIGSFGTAGAGNQGLSIQSLVGSLTVGGAIYLSSTTPSASNYALFTTTGGTTAVNATSTLALRLNNVTKGTITSAGMGIGSGAVTPTALLTLGAGSTAAGSAPLKFTSGSGMTTGETGAVEYNGTNLFFTRSGTTRENVFTGVAGATAPSTTVGAAFTSYYGSGITSVLGIPNSWAIVVLNATSYKIPLYT